MAIGSVGQGGSSNIYNFKKMMDAVRGAGQTKRANNASLSLQAPGKDEAGKMFLAVMDRKGQTAAKIGMSSANSTLSGKKESGYNSKEFTSQITRSKTPQNARMVATQIRARINELQSKLNSGEYDEADVLSAIAHAEALERAALKRADNLEKEEMAEIRAERKEREEELTGEEETEGVPVLPGDPAFSAEETEKAAEEIEAEMQKLQEEMQREEMRKAAEEMTEEMLRETEKLAEETGAADELSQALAEMDEILTGSMTPEEIEEMKKRHRAQENLEIERADMEYLKSKFDRLQAQKEALKQGGALVNLGGASMNAKEFSAAVKTLSAAARSASFGTSSGAPAASPAPAADAAAPSVSVDVSV